MVTKISPIEHISPTLEYSGGGSIGDLKSTIQAIEFRINRTRKSMRTIRTMLSNQENMDWKQVEEYQSLNEQLRALEIYKAEFKYHRRMI